MNPTNNGTGDGFSPRKSEEAVDPLDEQPFGDKDASVTQTVRYKLPESVINRREPAPTHRPESKPYATRKVNNVEQPHFSLENLDEKITSRPHTQRTRLVERRSWEQPVIAANVTREVPQVNSGWVPVPAPTQLVQK